MGDVVKQRVDRLNKVFRKYQGRNQSYAAKFFYCEFFNLINVIMQIFLINRFIGGKSLTTVPDSLTITITLKVRAIQWMMFPKMGKCQFNRHGPGGDINNHD